MGCDEFLEDLSALADGELDGEKAAAVRKHVDACGDCRARLADYRALGDLLGLDSDAEPGVGFLDSVLDRVRAARRAAPVGRRLLQVLAAAAAAALLVSAIVLISHIDGQGAGSSAGPSETDFTAPEGFAAVEKAVLEDPELLDILHNLDALDDLELLENLPVLERMDDIQAPSADELSDEVGALIIDPDLPLEIGEKD